MAESLSKIKPGVVDGSAMRSCSSLVKASPIHFSHFSRYIRFILLGCWVAWVGTPALASTSTTEQAGILSQQRLKRKLRQSRPLLRSRRSDDDLPPQVNGRSAGSRGCMVETAAEVAHPESRDRLPALMLLSPLDSIAQTQSTQPLLAWYLRDSSPNPFIFRLYEVEGGLTSDNLNDPQQVWTLLTEVTLPPKHKRFDASTQHHATAQAGISVLKLSALPGPPKLRVGGDYVWQIEMICDPERPSRSLFAQAALKMVAPPPQNLTQLKTPVLGELLDQGLWQDALAISLENSGTSLHSSAQAILDSVVMNHGELEALQQATIHH